MADKQTICERMGITPNQRRRLAHYTCGLCDQQLSREQCASIYGPRCTEEQMRERRQKCLASMSFRRVIRALREGEGEKADG